MSEKKEEPDDERTKDNSEEMVTANNAGFSLNVEEWRKKNGEEAGGVSVPF